MKKLIMFCHALCCGMLCAQSPLLPYRYYVSGALSPGLLQQAPLGGVSASVGFRISEKGLFVVSAQEMYHFGEDRFLAPLHFGYRHSFGKHWFAGADFTHSHEFSRSDGMKEPLQAAMGSGKFITHRSGISMEAGYTFKNLYGSSGITLFKRMSPYLSIRASYLPDEGRNPLLSLNAGLRAGI